MRIPTNQMSFEFGRSLRDEGIDLVLDHTPQDWITQFEAFVLRVPVGSRLTSEDIRRAVGDPPNHLNAIGAQMNAVIKKGWIKKIGFTQAHRSPAHARSIGIYERI